jgi:hypothetical protein
MVTIKRRIAFQICPECGELRITDPGWLWKSCVALTDRGICGATLLQDICAQTTITLRVPSHTMKQIKASKQKKRALAREEKSRNYKEIANRNAEAEAESRRRALKAKEADTAFVMGLQAKGAERSPEENADLDRWLRRYQQFYGQNPDGTKISDVSHPTAGERLCGE